MTAPTTLELKLIETLRENTRDLELDQWQTEEMFLVSWIRARENDLVKAEDMLRKSITWRKNEGIADIFKWKAPEFYSKAYECYITGCDNDGRPVVYLPLGKWDIRKVVDAGERKIYVKYVDQVVANFISAIRETKTSTGHHHTQFLIIMDLKGIQFRQVRTRETVETILETFRRFEANYPETLFHGIIINAPRFFPLLFGVVKPILSQRTRNKLQVFNSNTSKWKAALTEKMPTTSFPTVLDEFGKTDELAAYNDNLLDNGACLIEKQIEAGGKLEIPVKIQTLNSLLTWEFDTLDYDIGFTVLEGGEPCHFPYKRYDSNLEKVSDSIICDKVGKYTFIFDNSYSRFRTKSLRFQYSIISADGA